jgi:alpha-tubulin suppressor-like RCC1 family protein
LGDGTLTMRKTPVTVSGLTTATAIAAGGAHTCARLASGAVRCWGFNADGQLGDGTRTTRRTPVAVTGLSGVSAIAAGDAHTCARLSSGALRCWGDNSSGQLGDPAIVTNAVPQIITSTVPPSAANNWTAVAAGDFHTLALKSDGTLWAWGDNTSGQLGLSIGNSSMPTPNQVTTTNLGNFDRNWVAIAAGGAHSLGLQSDGTLWAWGSNTSGQLGDPFIVSNNTPNQIVDLTSVIPGFNSSWVAIAAGLSHSLALQADGTAWAWGFNQFGQLGNNDVTPTPADHPAPVLVFNSGSAPYISIAAGDSFSVARKADGSLWSWGKNTAGQLGIGSTDAEPAPAHATPLRESTSANDWTVAGVGGQHSIALKAGGLLNGWGDNTFGQLGDGSTATKNNPTALLEPAISVPAALNFVTAAVTVGPFPSTPFTIANTGSSTLVVSSMTITGTDNTMFARVPGGTCSATFPFNLATGASCTATVTFTPTSAGLKTATLSVNSNAPVTPIATVSLSGTGVLPFSIAASVSVSSPLNSGTISPAGSVPVAPGANQTFVFIPNAGFRVLDVIVDDISRGASASYTFSAVQGNHTIAVIYIGTQTIAAISGAGGTISPIGSVTINQGDNKNFIITPDYGFAISDVVVVEMVENLDINGNGLGTFSPVTTHLGPVSSFTFFNVRAPGSIIAASFIATDIRTWNWRNPLPQGLTIRHAETDGNGNYAAVGEFGIIMTSTNGVDWTVRQSGTMNLNGVAYGNGKFVTVGNGGRILQSSTLAADGYATWNEQSSGTASPLNGVIFNGSVFVAVGNSQISENFPFVPRMTIITSPDGVTWTDHSPLLALNETLDLRDIAAGTGG